ncbi:MAG: hypothetical protein ABSF95_02490 [Verrucomicrobiota bacterium]|jgi:spermidine synthase
MSAPDQLKGGSQRRPVLFALLALGFSCVMTQLALMRELLGAFSGNEMVLGVVLGLWLLLMGLGAWLGRFCARGRAGAATLAAILIWLAVLPPVQIFLVRALRNIVFIRGAAIGVTGTVGSASVVLLPYCLAAGCALSLGCALLAREEGAAGIGRGYITDSAGSIAGGILFSLVLVRCFDHIAILVCPALLNLLAAAGIDRSMGQASGLAAERLAPGPEAGERPAPLPLPVRSWSLRAVIGPGRRSWLAGGLGLALLAAAVFADPDGLSTRLQYSRQHLVARANSPYGKLVLTESEGQLNFLENGVPLTSTGDDQHVEETVHYALAQRPDARNVLLVSGGVGGTAREILKYPVNRIDYVELDPLILELGRKYLPANLADPRIHVINTDGRLFIKQKAARQVGPASRRPVVGQASRLPSGRLAPEGNAGETPAPLKDQGYDLIILDVPAPATAQLNRFYTVEFLAEAKRALARNGVLSFSLGQYENYVSPELARLLASAYRTVRCSFPNTLMIPGGRVFFLASEGPLFADIARRLEERQIKTKLVNRHYLDAMLAPDRMADLVRAVAQPAALNKDLSPILYFYHLRHWMSQFNVHLGPLQWVLLLMLGFYLVRLRRSAFVLFASGFAASALEIVLLLAFQVLCGSVYHQVGLIVTVFMLGLALGAWLVTRGCRRAPLFSSGLRTSDSAPNAGAKQRLWLLAAAIAVYALFLPLLLPGLDRLGGTAGPLLLIKTLIAGLTFVLGALVGMQFPLANQLESAATPASLSRLYTADFVGASLGALLACTLLIPLLGVPGVCLLTAALNALAAVVMRTAERRVV